LEEWISECQKCNITVKAEAGLEAIALFQGEDPKPQGPPLAQYSPEHFINALTDFIIATDQVFYFIYFIF
jgi:hypothetical protein